jgi:glycosyltransferase involved in cell wall biosynthesis
VTAPPGGGTVPVTVVIAAHNEAGQIEACLRSVSWAGEALVVENDSSDDTIGRARAAGATVFSHPFRSIGAQRNAAIARAAHPWVLVLDADERATPALGSEVAMRIGNAGAEAWRVRRRSWFLGREIRHSGWDRDRPVRLFRRHLRYDERPVHEHVLTTAEPRTLDEALLHQPYANLGEYFEKLGRYSRDWAAQNHARGKKTSVLALLLRPQARFLSTLLVRGGWRDGWHGLVISLLAGVSVAAKYAHLWALQQADSRARDTWPS